MTEDNVHEPISAPVNFPKETNMGRTIPLMPEKRRKNHNPAQVTQPKAALEIFSFALSCFRPGYAIFIPDWFQSLNLTPWWPRANFSRK
jgi:hypothetical protein